MEDRNTIEKLVGINLSNPPITVQQRNLERANSDSKFKSICPACKEGILPMHRHFDTFNLKNTDRCILCGQAYIYSDIEDNKFIGIPSLKLKTEEQKEISNWQWFKKFIKQIYL